MIFLQFSISVLLGVISVHGQATLTEQRTMEVDMSADNYRYVAYHHKATCKPRLCNGSLVVLCACKGELTSLSSLMSGHLRSFCAFILWELQRLGKKLEAVNWNGRR